MASYNKIHFAAKYGDAQLLQSNGYRTEVGDDDIFRRKCEFLSDLNGLSCLHIAAENGSLDVLRILVQELKVDMELKNDDGDTALLQAAKNESFEAATYLINHGADVNARGYRGRTCLHSAAFTGNIPLMKLLLCNGADINAVSALGTPLLPAASHGGVEAVRFLLSRGADPNILSPNFAAPVIGAIVNKSDECLKVLLQCRLVPTPIYVELHGTCPLAKAVTTSTSLTKILIDAGANPIASTESIMHNFHLLTLMNSAASSRGNQDYKSAIISYTKASNSQPDNLHEVLYLRSICYEHLAEYDCSLYDAENCIKLNQFWPNYYSRAGEVCVLLKNFTKACRYFKLAISMGPASEEIADGIKEKHRFALKKMIQKSAEFDLHYAIALLQETVSYNESFYMHLRDLADREPLEAREALNQFMDGPIVLSY